jgi:hypothetical protein
MRETKNVHDLAIKQRHIMPFVTELAPHADVSKKCIDAGTLSGSLHREVALALHAKYADTCMREMPTVGCVGGFRILLDIYPLITICNNSLHPLKCAHMN